MTYSGNKKPLYYYENRHLFEKFSDKIIHNVIDDTPSVFPCREEPYTTSYSKTYPWKHNGIPLSDISIHFQREVFQRDRSIRGILRVANDDDIIMTSDVDEIPSPNILQDSRYWFEKENIHHLCQTYFMYYLNNIVRMPWYGTRVCSLALLKKFSVDLIRHATEDRSKLIGTVIDSSGWHLSYMGGEERIREKIRAYSHQEVNNEFIHKNIKNIIDSGADIFLRKRQSSIVDICDFLPQYVCDNRDKFSHLIK